MVGDAKRYVCVNIGGLNFIDTVVVEKLQLNGQTVTLRTLQTIEKKQRTANCNILRMIK